ncbi:hypothetical protein RFI_34904, partial [Reticulomyxa filosa]
QRLLLKKKNQNKYFIDMIIPFSHKQLRVTMYLQLQPYKTTTPQLQKVVTKQKKKKKKSQCLYYYQRVIIPPSQFQLNRMMETIQATMRHLFQPKFHNNQTTSSQVPVMLLKRSKSEKGNKTNLITIESPRSSLLKKKKERTDIAQTRHLVFANKTNITRAIDTNSTNNIERAPQITKLCAAVLQILCINNYCITQLLGESYAVKKSNHNPNGSEVQMLLDEIWHLLDDLFPHMDNDNMYALLKDYGLVCSYGQIMEYVACLKTWN